MSKTDGEDRVMERLCEALVSVAHYAARVDRLPSYSTAKGPMKRKLSRLHAEAARAMRNARDFDVKRANRIWAEVERVTLQDRD